MSNQSAERVVRLVHDETDNALRTKIVGADVEVNVNAVLGDSIAIADEGTGDRATVTDVGGGKKGLDVVVRDIAISADNDSIENRAQGLCLRLDDTSTPMVTYIGEALPGALPGSSLWRIKKIDETSGLTITWADGNSNFDNNWNNRVSLTYI